MLAYQRDVNRSIREFFLHLPFREKGPFLWLRVCVCILNLWGESNNKVVRGVGRDPIGDACSKLETFSSRPQLRDVTSI